MSPTTFKADLHCHSTFSDGTDSPEKLIEKAIAGGLSGLSITDHDTVAAYATALPFAEQKTFPLLPGVEFSASYRSRAIHVLGYAFSVHAQPLQQLCDRHRLRRLHRNRQILEKLCKLGIVLDEQELNASGHMVGRPHIANLMIARGVVHSMQEAFDRYLGEGKQAYDPGEPLSVLETIEAIHAAGGKAVLAHPHLIKGALLTRRILDLPFDGIEGYYARFHADQNEKWIEIGRKRGWIVTGGSDYHGDHKPLNVLGCSWTGQELFEQLYADWRRTAPQVMREPCC